MKRSRVGPIGTGALGILLLGADAPHVFAAAGIPGVGEVAAGIGAVGSVALAFGGWASLS